MSLSPAMSPSAPVCPVPAEQQPINEYQELKESWFFHWATLEGWGYIKPIVILWGLSWIFAAPVASASFAYAKHPVQFFLSAAAGACVIPVLALVRLFLGWLYVRDRLTQETIFYEESGWYDGQVWTKPQEVLHRDRLIVTYQIQAILQRLKLTFAGLAVLMIAGGVIWKLL